MSVVKGISLLNGNISIYGNVVSDDTVDVSGYFKGKIVANEIIVKENGALYGEIYANSIILSGNCRVVGVIKALKIKILKSSEISGEVEYNLLSIEDGAKMIGTFNLIKEEEMKDFLSKTKEDLLKEMQDDENHYNESVDE